MLNSLQMVFYQTQLRNINGAIKHVDDGRVEVWLEFVLEDKHPFCGATDTPVLDCTFPEIYLWCITRNL